MKILKIPIFLPFFFPLDFAKFQFPPDFVEFKNPVPPSQGWVGGEGGGGEGMGRKPLYVSENFFWKTHV